MKILKWRWGSRKSGRSNGVFTWAVSIMLFALATSVEAAPGDLDPTFGTGGKVIVDFFGGSDTANALALQADGKIVIAGGTSSADTGWDFALARLNSDGTLDHAFGDSGKVTLDFFGAFDAAMTVAMQPDGKILVAGQAGTGNSGFDSLLAYFALARFNPDGSLDTGFGKDGKVVIDFFRNGVAAYAMAFQPDGKILLAGGGKILDPGSVFLAPDSDFALVRFNSDGTLDTAFGDSGRVTTDFARRF